MHVYMLRILGSVPALPKIKKPERKKECLPRGREKGSDIREELCLWLIKDLMRRVEDKGGRTLEPLPSAP